MNRLFPIFTLMTLVLPPLLYGEIAPPAPHDTSRGVTCASCHTSHRDNLSGGERFNNACLSCHRPGDPQGGGKPFAIGDQADPFGRYTANAPRKKGQTSHRFTGMLRYSAAGAALPETPELAAKLATIGEELACTLCHNQHDNTNGKFLRIPNDRDQLCLDCHRSRNVQSHTRGSHPVMVTYSAAYRSRSSHFNERPLDANADNPTATLAAHLTSDDRVVCTTCHAVHYADSRSSTIDAPPGFTNLSSGDGNLLRTDLKGRVIDPRTGDYLNICSTCHTGKFTHNGRGQNIQCTDCHGAHTGANRSLIRERMAGAATLTIFTSSTRNNYADSRGTGVCQACHAIPQGAGYPMEHTTLTDCATCHSHGASRSAGGSFTPVGGSCTSCHGYPPTSGKHQTHTLKGSYSCGFCHYSTTPDGSTITAGGTHRNGTPNVLFAFYTSSEPILRGTTSWSDTTKECSNIYCHGNGQSMTPVSAPISWNTGGLGGQCNDCHQGPAGLNSGSHQQHYVKNSIQCLTCHRATIDSDPTYGNTNPTFHVNQRIDVSLYQVGETVTYDNVSAAYPSRYAKIPGRAPGSCSNTTCHGTSSPVWGTSTGVGCAACHDYDVVGSELTGGVWSGGYWGKFPQSSPDGFGAHARHINHIKTRLGYTSGLNAVNQAYGEAESDNLKVCGTCHSTNPVDHLNGSRQIFYQSSGNHPFMMGGSSGTSLLFGTTNPSYSAVDRTCSNLSCHYFTSPRW